MHQTQPHADAHLNSAVHYIKGLLQELPFEILWSSGILSANLLKDSKILQSLPKLQTLDPRLDNEWSINIWSINIK